jgi:hypothetical protein
MMATTGSEPELPLDPSAAGDFRPLWGATFSTKMAP